MLQIKDGAVDWNEIETVYHFKLGTFLFKPISCKWEFEVSQYLYNFKYSK
jgi:hypothetical protein